MRLHKRSAAFRLMPVSTLSRPWGQFDSLGPTRHLEPTNLYGSLQCLLGPRPELPDRRIPRYAVVIHSNTVEQRNNFVSLLGPPEASHDLVKPLSQICRNMQVIPVSVR